VVVSQDGSIKSACLEQQDSRFWAAEIGPGFSDRLSVVRERVLQVDKADISTLKNLAHITKDSSFIA
jgi:hypothetical protein